MKKVALHNLGCKVNAYETEAMQQLLEDAGYEIVPFREGADVYIINTCSVTNVADRKSRQMLHRAKKMNPSAAVVAVGCYVQAAGAGLKKDEAVDLIVGNNQKKDLVQILDDYFADHENSGEILDIGHSQEYEELHIRRIADHTRAFIKVQDGCNQFCSYCIIPYTRGRVRSRRPEDIEREVRGIAEAGYREIVLTGIHLSSYGVDFKDEQKENLLTLIKRLDQIPGIERLRLGSLEPRIVTREFAKELASLRTICPHFHLSLQSGCDATLKRMNRKYDTARYMESCDLLRQYFDDPAITTDLITGFPEETEEEFAQTLDFIARVGFADMHVFPYSIRPGTKAAEMRQIDMPVREERAARASAVAKTMHEAYLACCVGKIFPVLFERDRKGGSAGHAPNYMEVSVAQEGLHNQVKNVKITAVDGGSLRGELEE